MFPNRIDFHIQATFPSAGEEAVTSTAHARFIDDGDVVETASNGIGLFNDCPAGTSTVDLSVIVYPRKCRLC